MTRKTLSKGRYEINLLYLKNEKLAIIIKVFDTANIKLKSKSVCTCRIKTE